MWRWPWPDQRRQEFKDMAKAAEEAYKKNSLDTESLKNWAKALIDLAACDGQEYKMEDIDLLNDAISKLDEVLRMQTEDNEARFLKGLSYCRITHPAWPGEVDDDAIIDNCDKAIECLKKVKTEAPEVYRDCGLLEIIQDRAEVYRGHKTIESVQDPLPANSAPPEYMKFIEIDWKDVASLRMESARNPNNAENFRRWGIALVKLSYFRDYENETRGTIAEAIPKLEKALLLDPSDREAKQELLKAYEQLIQLCQGKGLYAVERPPAVKGETSSVEKNEYTEDGDMYEEDSAFFEYCEIEAARNPRNADNWKRWGTALMKLSCQESGHKKREMIAEAIAKFEIALIMYPKDNKAKQKLMKAYDQFLTDRRFCEVEMSAEVNEKASSLNENEVAEQKNKRRKEESPTSN